MAIRPSNKYEMDVRRYYIPNPYSDESAPTENADALCNRRTIDVPEEWPLALQVFVLWLVLIIWKR